MALILPAYAKLNLTLDVTGRRPNGYHDIDSVMQTISLHDLISVERTDCRVFDVVGPSIEGENLVLKAARELEGRVGRALPFTIRLFKRIPMAAGLAGGSSDAAAFLRAANQLYDLKLKSAELAEIAAEVGHDVPFLLRGGTVHATGLGSTISPLPPVPMNWRFLVVCPPVQVATRVVYEAVAAGVPSRGWTRRLVDLLTAGPHPDPPPETGEGNSGPHPDPPPKRRREILENGGPHPDPPPETGEGNSGPHPDPPPKRGREILENGGPHPDPPPGTGEGEEGREIFGNDLEPVARKLFPALDQAIERLRAVVPTLTMTGTGAALFAKFDNRREAEAALAAVRQIGFPTWVCRPVPASA